MAEAGTKTKADASVENTEESEESLDEDISAFMKYGRSGRRASVSAEVYDPSCSSNSLENIEFYKKNPEQEEAIKQSIVGIFLFRALDNDQLSVLVNAMMPRQISAGEVVIKQGDEGDYFYVVENGVYEAYVTKKGDETRLVRRYDNQGSFGELSLMYNEPRAATVKAVTDGFLWAVSRHTFKRLILRSAYEKRKRYESLLSSVPELVPLSSYDRANLCDALVPQTYEEGEIIFRQGDSGDGMYFVEKGEVTILRKSDENGEERPISRLYEGSYFGELALLTCQPRAATARASTKVQLAFLDREGFERLLGPCTELLEQRTKSYEKAHASDNKKTTAE